MPITSENYKKAEDWLSRAKSDPSVNKAKVAQIEQDLRSYYEGESSGALSSSDQSSNQSDRRSGIAGYYYEPSLDEFHSAIKNPEVYKRIGSPDINLAQQGDKSSGAAYIESKVPELAALNKTDTEHLGEESPEYKAYSDYAYNQEKAKNPDLKRYNDLEITQNPFKKSLGAAIKYGAPAALGAEKSIGLGLPRRVAATIAGNTPDSAANVSYDPMGAPQGEYHPEKAEAVMKGAKQLESLSPTANLIGNAAGYAAPIAPANLAARGMMAGLGYEAAGPLTKAVISGLTGSAVASGEGAAQDVIENPGISGQQLLDNTKGRAFWGGVGGSVLDPVAQLAGRTQTAFEESPRWNSIKNQKDIGGDTNFITGIETTPSVKENVRLGTAQRENKTPQDIAAQKVAPEFRKSIELKNANAKNTVNANLEEYLNRPEIANQQESMQPVAKGILDMFNKGTFEGAVTGDIKHSNQAAVDTFKKALLSIGEVAHMPPEEAALYAKNNGGMMISPKTLKALGVPSEAGKVPVYVASKTNARALLEMEQMIDEKLKMAGTEGGINNPIWKDINRSVKSVRDRFGVPAPEFNDPGMPFNPASDIEPQPNIKAQDKPQNVYGSTPPEAEPGIGPFQKNPNFMDPGNPFKGASDLPVQPDIGVTSQNSVGINLPKGPEALPGIGNSPRAMNANPFARQGAYAMQPDVPVVFDNNGRIVSHPAVSAAPEAQIPRGPQAETIRPKKSMDLPERRSPNRPTQDEWNSMQKPAGITADTPLSEHPEIDTLPPEQGTIDVSSSMLNENPSSIGREPTELSEARAKAVDVKTPKWRGPKKGQDLLSPEDRAIDNAKYKKDVISLSDEFSFGKEARKRDAERALRLAEEAGPVQRPYISQDEMEREMTRREWGSPRGEPDKRLTPENFDKVEKEAAKRFGVKPGEADSKALSPTVNASGKSSLIEDLGDSSVEEIAGDAGLTKSQAQEIVKNNAKRFTPKEEPIAINNGAESNLDAQLLQREIGDQAKLDGVPNPLSDKTTKTKSEVPEATLDDGTKVYGLSAVQRKNHLMLKELDDIEKALGTGTEESAHRKVLGYKTGEGRPYTDQRIAEEADKLGLRQQLEEIPATREYPGLRARAFAGGGEGPINTLKDAIGFRLDPILGAISGEPRNPYTPLPNTPAGRIQQYLFRQGVPMYPLLEQRGGIGAARFADDYADSKRKEQK